MVSTSFELPIFYFNTNDIQKQSFTIVEAAARRCFSKYVFLKFSNIHGKTPVLEPHFNKVAGLQLAIL